ncbi:hypothetical protein DRW07_01285 [Alteromonas sediminis]|uniref:Dienelactone hydrolase domain-containing protein n=1 Tax=Alteromonas sediminis TaxID=2259342 RepID=A0A3N5YEE0_9ALTE|nr:dienelactone hydrolase family protein [Alteromonas sediminis]RPJ68075.1 hypothetical protein DRW07_01285 [Alteromonas sediminis]
MKKLLFVLSITLCAFASHAKIEKAQLPFINYVSLPVEVAPGVNITTAGQLRIPRDAKGPVPAVILLHTTAGIDSTGSFYAKKLNNAGIATLELDLWGGRGLSGGATSRPAAPQETLPDAYTALAYLAQRPDIDANKIGIMGFSWGAVVTMLTATKQYDDLAGLPFKFAAHVAHYPICYGYNNVPGFEFENLTGAPVLIQSAELDHYDFPGACPLMVSQIPEADQAVVEVIEYKNVFHTWDRLEPEIEVFDPVAYLGVGGMVTLAPDKKTARKSRKKVVKFFTEVFETN